MAEWFEDWFNTEEYLDVYSHRNENDAKNLIDLILSKVNISPKSKSAGYGLRCRTPFNNFRPIRI